MTSTGYASSKTIKRQPKSARWGQELVDKLTIEPSNHKPKSATVVNSDKQPVDLQRSERVSLKVNTDEAPKDKLPEPAVAQKRWHVTEALIEEHGRAMGCPRCSNRVGVHNAECRGWIEGTMLRQSRIHQVAEQRRSRYRWNQRNRQGQQRNTEAAVILVFSEATSPVRSDDEELPEVPDIAMDAEDSCEAQVKRQGRSWAWICACCWPGKILTMRLRGP